MLEQHTQKIYQRMTAHVLLIGGTHNKQGSKDAISIEDYYFLNECSHNALTSLTFSNLKKTFEGCTATLPEYKIVVAIMDDVKRFTSSLDCD